MDDYDPHFYCERMYWDDLTADWCCSVKDERDGTSYSPCFLEALGECDAGGPFGP